MVGLLAAVDADGPLVAGALLPPPPVEQALISASIDAPRASPRNIRIGFPPPNAAARWDARGPGTIPAVARETCQVHPGHASSPWIRRGANWGIVPITRRGRPGEAPLPADGTAVAAVERHAAIRRHAAPGPASPPRRAPAARRARRPRTAGRRPSGQSRRR